MAKESKSSKVVLGRGNEPSRRTGGTYRIVTSQPGNRSSQQFARIDPSDHYSNSQLNLERISRKMLRAFADILPAQTAIKRIVDGVSQMPFSINPPKADKNKDSAQALALQIERSLRRPNSMEQKTWGLFVSAVTNELLVMGNCPIERQQSLGKKDQLFWMWPCNSDFVVPNPDWTPQNSGATPRYYDISLGSRDSKRIDLMDSELFMLQQRSNSWQVVPPSPLESAFKMISAWLGVTDYQQNTTSNVSQEVILFLGEITDKQYNTFKEWWQNDVQGTGEIPILAGKGKPEAIKVGANNDTGLYLGYTDFLLKMIGLAFLLRPNDYNIEKETNFATAGISADASFQFAMVPTARAIMGALQVEILDLYHPGFTIELSDMEKRSEKDEADIANILFAGNIATQNEVRLRVGLPSLGAVGEHFVDGSKTEEAPMIRQEIDEKAENPEPEPAQFAPNNLDATGKNNGKAVPPNGKAAVPVPAGKENKSDKNGSPNGNGSKKVPVKASGSLLPRPIRR